jgi:heat-inducible transcriptional repressor
VLVVVVAAGGQISHRVIQTNEQYDASTLSQAANYINAEFAGLTLDEARRAIMERMREERLLYDALMARALRLADSGLAEMQPVETLHVQGASFLIDEMAGEPADRRRTMETLRVLFEMLEEKHRLVELLSRSLEAGGLTVVIGSENTAPALHPFSVVISTFQDGDRTGTVGVIGPTRMRYQRAISVVDGVSRAVTRLLENH